MSKTPPAHDRLQPDRARLEGSEHDIGSALRAAYDSALNEDIPPEMLELLRKLR